MGTNKRSGNRRRKKSKEILERSMIDAKEKLQDEGTATNDTRAPKKWNFVSNAGLGCYIARRDKSPEWLIEWEDVDPKEFLDDDNNEVGDEIPDIAVDTDEQTLSVCNIDDYTKIAYVTVYETTIVGAHGRPLTPGSTTDNNGSTHSCITFIVLCPPRVFVHLCYLNIPPNTDITTLRIESDVSKWNQHPNPSDEHRFRIGFPLTDEKGSYLCTQGEGGELTHFFSGNLHAIDFQCPIGTELFAVADAIVIESKDTNTLTGIAVTNLFEWNNILLKVKTDAHDGEGKRVDSTKRANEGNGSTDDPLFVEYVHIQKSLVKAGDHVQKGQIIGYSGSVGFSPEPHLHFSAFRSPDPEAPTVRVRFQTDDGQKTFLPQAGERYNREGKVNHSPATPY